MAYLTEPGGAPLILASSSAARTRMLTAAGVAHRVDPPAVDEDTVKESLAADDAPGHAVAETLAELKALSVAQRHPDCLVIGADQVLAHDGILLDKPASLAAARTQLTLLSGGWHSLHSGVCVVQGDRRLWHQNDEARLEMRDLSSGFIGRYLSVVGDEACHCVGAYQLEGLGAQLFARVQGDFFTVLGMPLLPLLGFLRVRGVLAR